MKILFDLTYVKANNISGVTNYAYRLLDGFNKCNFNSHVILLATPENAHIITKNITGYPLVRMEIKSFKYQHFNGFINKRALNNIIKKYNIDLFVSPYIVFHGLYTKKIPSVGVFHDAQGFQLMGNIIKQFAYNLFTKHILQQFTTIVTISNYAKNDIIEKVPNISNKLQVIYNSILPVTYSVPCEREKTIKYILNVNTLEPYKNLITLIKAFNLLKHKIPHSLYIKAKRLPYWDNVILPFINEHNIGDRVKLIEKKYTEEEMASLYQNADLFVSPSLMEGFGFTPIEAALYGIPVICSKESALYETTRGLLNYYAPATDENQLATAILQQINQAKDQAKLLAISNEYKDCYSTQKQAEQFITIFNSLK